MAIYISGANQSAEVAPENEAAFIAAGWGPLEDTKPSKSEKDDK